MKSLGDEESSLQVIMIADSVSSRRLEWNGFDDPYKARLKELGLQWSLEERRNRADVHLSEMVKQLSAVPWNRFYQKGRGFCYTWTLLETDEGLLSM